MQHRQIARMALNTQELEMPELTDLEKDRRNVMPTATVNKTAWRR